MVLRQGNAIEIAHRNIAQIQYHQTETVGAQNFLTPRLRVIDPTCDEPRRYRMPDSFIRIGDADDNNRGRTSPHIGLLIVLGKPGHPGTTCIHTDKHERHY